MHMISTQIFYSKANTQCNCDDNWSVMNNKNDHVMIIDLKKNWSYLYFVKLLLHTLYHILLSYNKQNFYIPLMLVTWMFLPFYCHIHLKINRWWFRFKLWWSCVASNYKTCRNIWMSTCLQTIIKSMKNITNKKKHLELPKALFQNVKCIFHH
jgi:hypothetical protein